MRKLDTFLLKEYMMGFTNTHAECQCSACNANFGFSLTVDDLQFFLANNPHNQMCKLDEFEDFEFASVIHWDVGHCNDARYYVYRDGRGETIAWYDNANSSGYKSLFV